MQHGVTGEVNQIAPVDEGNNLHPRRQDMVVQFLHFLVNPLQRRIRRRAFAQQHDARHYIVVIDNLSIFPVNRLRELPQPNLRTCETTAMSLIRSGVPFLVR